MMNTYEAKRAARIERMEARIARLRKFAEGKDLSLYGEEKSGIPMGQPILVGHHSERRHRRHLERIERLVRAGYDARAKAAQLAGRLAAMKDDNTIQIDNPEAGNLINQKLAKLETLREQYVMVNKLVRKALKGAIDREDQISVLKALIEAEPKLKDKGFGAESLLTPDFCGRTGVPGYMLSNLGAEIRRLKARQGTVAIVQAGFEPLEINGIKVEFVDGQVQVDFGYKPCEETRTGLKRLAMKWSRYSQRWVRKHTAATAGQYFRQQLVEILKEAKA